MIIFYSLLTRSRKSLFIRSFSTSEFLGFITIIANFQFVNVDIYIMTPVAVIPVEIDNRIINIINFLDGSITKGIVSKNNKIAQPMA